MSHSKIHAYVRCLRLEQVEQALLDIGVGGFSCCRVKGAGEYVNYFNQDHLVEHALLEVFVPDEQVEEAVQAIMEAGGTNAPGDGIVAVMPVSRLFRVRDKAELDGEVVHPL